MEMLGSKDKLLRGQVTTDLKLVGLDMEAAGAGVLKVSATRLRLTLDEYKAVSRGPNSALLVVKIDEVTGLRESDLFPFTVRAIACGVSQETGKSLPRTSKRP